MSDRLKDGPDGKPARFPLFVDGVLEGFEGTLDGVVGCLANSELAT
jgi:hypothetical protein